MNEFAIRLRELRRAQKLSQKKLALLTGVSQPYIAELEQGVKKPSVELLQRLCDPLGCSADYLLGIGKNIAFVAQPTSSGGLTMEMLEEITRRNITPQEFDRALKVATVLREEETRLK